ncbi:hypothetical protein D018_2756A, partial [Vibrio parahaemolyticus VP2007-007]|jgi:hypothetical protein
MYAN